MGRRSALLVATYDYSDTSLQRLAAPGRDVEALAGVLADPKIAGFDVKTVINKPHHIVGEAIGDFFSGLRREDLALLYFTGHGLKDDKGRLFLPMTNSRRDGLLFTAIGADQINDAMNSCSSRQKVLILDCCYGGAFPGGWTAKGDADVHSLERFQGRGRVVLTASDAAQYSFEGDNLSGTGASSLFTHYLVEGIRTGKADLDGDGDVSLDELYSYVHDRVTETMPQQRPKKQEDVEGRIVIAHNIGWTLPTHVQYAINSPVALDRQTALQSLSHLYRVGNETVRRQVIEQVQNLVDDDSRRVSAEAVDVLRTMIKPNRALTDAEQNQSPRDEKQGDAADAKSVPQRANSSENREWAPAPAGKHEVPLKPESPTAKVRLPESPLASQARNEAELGLTAADPPVQTAADPPVQETLHRTLWAKRPPSQPATGKQDRFRIVPVPRVIWRILLWWCIFFVALFASIIFGLTVGGRYNPSTGSGISGFVISLAILIGLAVILRREILIQRQRLIAGSANLPSGVLVEGAQALSHRHVRRLSIGVFAVSVVFATWAALTVPPRQVAKLDLAVDAAISERSHHVPRAYTGFWPLTIH